MWIMVALSGALGFGFGLLVRRQRRKPRRLPSPVEELLDQAELLPIKGVFTEKHEYHSARVMELEGGIRLLSWDYSPDTAHLYHNKVEVKLTERQRARLGRILNERITTGALDSVNTRLLEP